MTDCSEENSFYELIYAQSLNTSFRKAGGDDCLLEIKEKQKQIEELVYQVKLLTANNQTLKLQNQMSNSEIERLLRFIMEQQQEMKKMALKGNRRQVNKKAIRMQLINSMCLEANSHMALDQLIHFETIIDKLNIQ